MKSWYEYKTQNVKKGKIRMAACRKIIVQIFHMLKKREYHYYRDEANHTNKMIKYDRFLCKHGLNLHKVA